MTESRFQTELNGHLITLRPVKLDDFEALYQCASDPLIWTQHPQSNRYERNVFQTFFDGAIRSNGALVVLDRQNDQIIGSSRFYDFNPTDDKVTIGYTFLARKYWGGRYNREMKGLMLAHAFRFVGHVFFEIGETNHRSLRAIEKIGAKFFKRQELDGKTHLVFRLSKSDFSTAAHGEA